MTTELLSDEQIATALQDLPDWTRSGDEISRTVQAESFPAAIALVDRVAEAAERAGHHPDIDIRWRTVTFTLSTHSAGGLTGRDIDLARQIDELAR
ncbi:4a-hydroxytetrahydrobiopterin dehydratase [Nocardia farcinica]|uniref:Putative pterin-4-alpha-carbinolamine dehydratase n=2 Tax=Nocardia farcinica TaxID=37329 RepID=PHS_NOCFA|nr:4a-hydroxytetrahydrobiopterin dehydratase [Nocardia farcinica]Q5YQC8.1 RecName: Full=Putative pterin-4-alpha-carbinolamine dehydratase; Short=PHS; AltName: Full=4-alpha-hydroxy-tetrahydropterin dehydratase; AltName: Full=Pterin carbinolamine dehydratase; Short=PCD [Nocardia farcinica IFM 10152]AXK87927.1 4a-hydroxytetrahydrobiopterin dehydratase [Nocardia farcinica]MBA4858142.1 4a-hydroxytetrahydrobiopterin dehydratase [Nocardia farcinica]MBC9816672.1 4a-hydroxytetrahydrobiopterin dehydratas